MNNLLSLVCLSFRYIERKKLSGVTPCKSPLNVKPKPQTRHLLESKREYMRLMKRKERENMTWQKKMWVRKKDRERKQQKRNELKRMSTQANNETFGSKRTEYNVTSKVRSALPTTPMKFAKVVKNILAKASPRKCKAFELLGRTTSTVKVGRTILKKSLKFTRGLRQRQRKSKVDVLGIRKFYLRDDVSRILPQKRYATKDGPGYAMQISLTAAHSKYLKENPGKKVSLGTFASLRKRNVRLLKASHREYCCCTYCVNVRFKLLTLSRATTDQNKKLTSETAIPDIVLCPKRDGQRYHEPACINGDCSRCRDHLKSVSEYYKSIPDGKVLTWSRWEYEKQSEGKKRRVIISKEGVKEECIKELVELDLNKPCQGTNFFQHLHTAQWQTSQFNLVKSQLTTGTVLQVMDFAKNREVKYQDEIKAAFYTARQITLHPIVTYYRSDLGLIRHSSIVISEDNEHDHHAVHHFETLVDKEIENTLGLKPNKKIVFSDGCSAQYKSKNTFADLAHSEQSVNRNYFGSEHGKGDCDADIGVLNSSIDRAIIGNQVQINCAYDLYKYCKEHLEIQDLMAKRTFHFVSSQDIQRDRPVLKVKTLKNTRKIHQALNVNSKEKLKLRNLSCFCQHCEVGDTDCLNSKYVQPYELKKLVPDNTEKNVKLLNSEQAMTGKTDENEGTNNYYKEKVKPKEPKENPQIIEVENRTNKLKQPENCSKMSSCEKNLTERQKYFESLVSDIEVAGRQGFEKLKQKCSDLESEINMKYPLKLTGTQFNFADNKYKADQLAVKLMPEELKTRGMLPVNVSADGNCLPRSASLLAFGSESEHDEMRVRIVIELCLNCDLYISNSFLNRGITLPDKEAKNIEQMYTMISDRYIPGEVITKTVTRRIFEAESISVCKKNAYMGIWQLFAVSSVLKRPVYSVYPDIVKSTVKLFLNRIILPRQDEQFPPVTVMWSSTRTDMEPQNWIPNHFVPVVPTYHDNGLPESDEAEDFSDVDLDLSLSENWMNMIMQSL